MGRLFHEDGIITGAFTSCSFDSCEEHTGALNIGQEQGSVGGDFDANQAAAKIVDTVNPQLVSGTACVDFGRTDL